MLLKLTLIPTVHTIVKWHGGCNERARETCLRYAAEIKLETTGKGGSEYLHSIRNYFRDFSNHDMEIFYTNPIANEHVSMKILKKYKELYADLNHQRKKFPDPGLSGQMTLMQHMGYSMWLASSGGLLIDGQENMFIELWNYMRPIIDNEYNNDFFYEDIPVNAIKKLDFEITREKSRENYYKS